MKCWPDIQKTVLDKSLVGYCIAVDGKIRYINPAAAFHVGYQPDKLIGKNATFLIHPQDRRRAKRNARAMLYGQRIAPYEFRIITKNKDIHWAMQIVVPITYNGKKAIMTNAICITQRKLAEQKLKESDNLYKTIFENTGTSMVIVEDDKTISLANFEFEKLTGYLKQDWEGKKKWSELVDRRDIPRMEKYHRLRRTHPRSIPRAYEFRLVDSQGKIKHLLNTASIIPGTKKHVSSTVDITGLKEKENELIQKTRNLEELNAALKVLLQQRENDKAELENTLLANMKDMVLPYIEKIRKNGVDGNNAAYIDLLAANLDNILSPFSRKLSVKYMHLTPKEIQVANFIKDGKQSKEIAELLNVSCDAVDVYRYRIRHKLGLSNKKINLRSYLATLS